MQIVLNFSWSPVFFSAHRIGLALIVILLLLGAILAFIATAWRQDRVAAWLFAPYAAWVAFASILNASILMLN
jgi:tryptophan-rich sensory protein